MKRESITRRKFLQGVALATTGFAIAPFKISSEPRGVSIGSSSESKSSILLVDDKHILYRSGTKRVLNPLKRYERNPVIAQTEPWETTIGYCSVHHNKQTGEYQLWYQSYVPSLGSYLSYATSDDGINWSKPNLGLIGYKGNKENNLVMPIGYGGSVIFDSHDPAPERRYKSVFWEQDKKPYGMAIAFSPDGIHWTKYAKNLVIKGSYGDYIQPLFEDDPIIDSGDVGLPLSTSDANDLIWDPSRKVYAVYSKTWIDGPKGTMHWKRAVVRTESKDFINWTKPQLVMAADDFIDGKRSDHEMSNNVSGGSGGVQFHSGPAFYYADMYFSMLQVMNPKGAGNMPIELAISHDGYNWERPFRNKFFLPPLEDKTKFDASLIWSNATPIILKDKIRFYYGAYSGSWNALGPYDDITSGIGLTTIPLDRFAGVKPIDKVGQITFKAIDLTNCQTVTLNADASSGTIRAELLDAEGYRVRGYSEDDAVVIKDDYLRHKVVWKNRNIRELTGSYRIRLHMVNAEVFALTLKKETAP